MYVVFWKCAARAKTSETVFCSEMQNFATSVMKPARNVLKRWCDTQMCSPMLLCVSGFLYGGRKIANVLSEFAYEVGIRKFSTCIFLCGRVSSEVYVEKKLLRLYSCTGSWFYTYCVVKLHSEKWFIDARNRCTGCIFVIYSVGECKKVGEKSAS